MPTATQVRSDANSFAAGLLAELATKQAAYLGRVARYWQGLSSHAVMPADGVALPPDRLRRPSDQSETWQDENYTLPATMPYRVAVNVYNGPSGHGYELVLEFGYSGQAHRRVINVGPETYRERAWRAG